MIYIIFILITTLLLFFVFYHMQYFMMFTPTHYKRELLSDEFELLVIKMNDGIELEGVVYEPHQTQEGSSKTILFFAGRSQDSVALIEKLSKSFPKNRVITFNYRSYGESQGVVSEEKIFEDALKIAEVVRKNYGEFYLLGYSLGSSVATYVASKQSVKALFLVGVFDSIALLAKEKYALPLRWVLRYKFDNISTIEKVDAPCYIFASVDDETTYIKNVRNLKKHVKNLKGYIELEHLTHKELFWSARVIKKIEEVIKDA